LLLSAHYPFLWNFHLPQSFTPEWDFHDSFPKLAFFNSFLICIVTVIYSTWVNVFIIRTLLVLWTDDYCIFNSTFCCCWSWLKIHNAFEWGICTNRNTIRGEVSFIQRYSAGICYICSWCSRFQMCQTRSLSSRSS
jgi:hypothetical protein